MKKHETRFIVILAIFIALALFILPRAWAVNVPLNVNLREAFGRTCDRVTLEVRAGNVVTATSTVYYIDELETTISIGPDTPWTVVLLVTADTTSDSVASWAFQYNYVSSTGTKEFSTPAYWNFSTDSVVLNYTVNSNTVSRRTRTGVQSYDTSFTVSPYSQYVVFYEIFQPGTNDPLNWYWSYWSDTLGTPGAGQGTVGSLTFATVTGSVYWPDGQPVVGAVIEARRASATNAIVTTSSTVKAIIAPLITIATTGTSGAFSLNLLRSNQFVNTGDKKYNIRGTYDGAEIFKIDGLIIPSTGNLNIADSIAARP